MHVHVQKLVSVVKMATVLEEYTIDEQHSVVRFLWAKELNAKYNNKEMFLFMVGSVCLIKRFISGSRNYLKDV
jgi:hypothetical protein